MLPEPLPMRAAVSRRSRVVIWTTAQHGNQPFAGSCPNAIVGVVRRQAMQRSDVGEPGCSGPAHPCAGIGGCKLLQPFVRVLKTGDGACADFCIVALERVPEQ